MANEDIIKQTTLERWASREGLHLIRSIMHEPGKGYILIDFSKMMVVCGAPGGTLEDIEAYLRESAIPPRR
jgi:hypothetical protein